MIHTFSFTDPSSSSQRYLLLDVESGAVHVLDTAAYDVARALEQGLDPLQLARPTEEIEEILAEFEELKQAGMFDSPERQPPVRQDDIQIIKSMCLHVAHDCNLRCKYCFASTGEFHGARMLMPFEVAKAALDFLIARSGGRKHLEVDLFGGEPLMNFDVVTEIVAYGRELEKRYGKIIRFTITTNGLALTEDKIKYLNREMHNIVLSLDGRKEVHDELRPAVNGKGSFDAILPKAQALVAARGDKEYYVRGTFTNNNLDFTQDVMALRDFGFEQLSIEPVVLPQESPYAITKRDVPYILEEYDRLSEFLLKSRREGKWFNFFHFMLDMDNGPCLKKRITGCGAGTEYIAVTPDGDIYPCHQFVGEDGFKMGNVLEGTFDEAMQRPFQGCNVRTKAACRTCWAKYFCSGGCAANAWKYNHDICIPEEITCAFERKRTECAIGINTLER